MNEKLNQFWSNKPLIISGPCSAETENQVLNTAIELAKNKRVGLLRAGVWKPRTKPGQFEGVGEIALNWLENARNQTGLPFAVEVAQASHVEKALAKNTDVLWIGARSTANPFSVQEIASSLKGVDVPVLIKNPTNPDIELWVGAVERIEKAGIKNIALVHRGFSYFGNSVYRNAPMWQIPIEMKRRFPFLPILCDPSHICGNRLMLHEIAQKSIDLDFAGLMIESHTDPDNAWSDAAQQITPTQLEAMLESLIWRFGSYADKGDISLLSKLRAQIDQYDDDLLNLLSQRMKLADEIGLYKRENNITILQTERWNVILNRSIDKAAQLKLSEEFIRKYYEAVHLESIQHQINVMNK